MILEGNQRGGAKNLALHLMKQENEHVEVHEIRGFASPNLMGALNEAYAISRATKSTQFLYSLSLNPPLYEKVSIADFEAAIDQVEKELNLEGQPRAIVFHEKEGRRHAHCVWSRIDSNAMIAIPIPYDHLKLQDVSRGLYLKHGWKMPRGFAKGSERDPKNFTLAQWQQAKRVGKNPNEIKTAIQDAWAISDTKATFSHALEERGYVLARGDRKGRIVAIDIHGEVYSIPKQIGIKVKQVRERLGDEDGLPTVLEAKQQISDQLLPTLEGFRLELEQQQYEHKTQMLDSRKLLIKRQRIERQAFLKKLKGRQQKEALERQARFRNGLRGVWDRLRGEHKHIQRLNERETKACHLRDQHAKDQMVLVQLSQRRMTLEQSKVETREIVNQKSDIQRDMEYMHAMPLHETQKPVRTRKRRR